MVFGGRHRQLHLGKARPVGSVDLQRLSAIPATCPPLHLLHLRYYFLDHACIHPSIRFRESSNMLASFERNVIQNLSFDVIPTLTLEVRTSLVVWRRALLTGGRVRDSSGASLVLSYHRNITIGPNYLPRSFCPIPTTALLVLPYIRSQ